ncbi:amidohydrolase family protein [Sutcliffiella horikoshii]|uniref:amidohydrolase family protein n=1 Tax=Sutcliffiella horikoshii TaxID=79883 RepID=UPI00384B17EA
MGEVKGMVLLKDANVLDVDRGAFYQASILMKDGMIADIFTENAPYEVSEVIDAKEKWVIPGLIDMHVHIKESFAPIFVAGGITSVRNTGGNVLELKGLMTAPEDSMTPRVFSADRVIDGPPGLWGETSPWNINVENSEVVIGEVKRQVEAGADFIKVYGWLSHDLMEKVVQEASRYNKEVSCDLIHSTEVNALDATEIGVKWNEHASGIIQAMYPNWSMKAEKSIWDEVDWTIPDLEKITAVCAQLLTHGVTVCPTMVLFDQMNRLKDHWNPDHELVKKVYENKSLIGQWSRLSQYEEALKQMGIQSALNKAIAKVYFDLGGTVVAGTDTPAGVWTYPGMALHRELELFVEAGFSELDAIRAATSVAARSIKRDDLGVIKAGAKADMILLSNNPLEDIKNTREIELVIKGGKVMTQAEILSSVPSEEESLRLMEEFVNSFEELMVPKG